MAEILYDINNNDPGPKPAPLTDDHRAKLDSIISKMISNKESDAAIQAVVNDYKSKYSTPTITQQQPAFQVQISQPGIKSDQVKMEGTVISQDALPTKAEQVSKDLKAIGADIPEIKTTNKKIQREFTGSDEVYNSGQFANGKPTDEYGLQKLHGKAREAQNKLNTELQSNDDQYEKKLREYRRDEYTIESLKDEYKKNGWVLPIESDLPKTLAAAKQRQYNLPVSKEDISDIKTGTILNAAGTRKFVKDLNKPEAQANAYLVDAFNHAVQDQQYGNQRVPKIEKNAKQIEKGDLVYDPEHRALLKPEGFIGSLFEGRKQLNKLYDDYDFFKDTKNDAAIVSQLNEDMIRDIDEPISVPKGKLGEIGSQFGGMPIKGMIGGGIAAIISTAAGHPESSEGAFNLVNAGLSASDMYKVGYASSLRNNYAQFKQQGLNDNEALQKARALAEDQANVDAFTGAAMGLATGKLAFKPTNALKTSLKTALTQVGETGAKKILEGMGVGTIGGTGQIFKNLMAQHAGLPTETTEGFKDNIYNGITLTAATHLIAKAPKLLTPQTYRNLVTGVSKVPEEAINKELQTQQQAGHITPEEAQNAHQHIWDSKVIDALIPTDIPEVDRLKMGAKIRERNLLKNKLENVDEAFHPEIKEQIKKLNEEIINLSKGSEQSEASKHVEKAISENKIPAHFIEEARKDPEAFMKFIADQSLGRMDDGSLHPAGPAEGPMIQQFGPKLVAKAKELYPKGEAPVESEILPGGRPRKKIVSENVFEWDETDEKGNKKYRAVITTNEDGSRTIELFNDRLDNRFGGQIIKVSKDFKGTDEEALQAHFAPDGEVRKVKATNSEKGADKVEPEKIGGVEVSEHGEDDLTAANKENGTKDSKLTDAGVVEAKELGKYLAEKGIKNVISSTVKRAIETAHKAAQHAADISGNVLHVLQNAVLDTWNIGKYDGKPEGSFSEEEWTKKPNEAPKDGESFNDFTKRMEKADKYIKSLPEDTHVVTHSKVMRALYALDKTNGKWTDETTQIFLNNKELSHAVQERSTEALSMDVPSGSSQKMGTGEPGAEEPTIPQGQAGGTSQESQTSDQKVGGGGPPDFDLPFVSEPSDDTITGIRNSITAQKIQDAGLNPVMQEAAKTHKEVWQEAVDKVRKGYNPQNLIDALKKKPRPLTDLEDALLLMHQIQKESELDAANKAITEAGQKGDNAAMEEAQLQKARVKDDLQDIYNIDKAVGTLNARGLSARQMISDRRYSLVNMEREYEASQGGKALTDQQRQQINDLYQKIRETQAAYEERLRQKDEELKKAAQTSIENKLKNEVKKEKVKAKIEKIKKDLSDNLDELKKIARNQGLGANPIALEALPVIAKMTKNLAKLGITKIEELTTNIYDKIKEIYGDDLTPDHVMEAIEAANNNERLNAYKARLQKSTSDILDKTATIAEGRNIPNKQQKGLPVLDEQAMKLKAANERAKAAFDEVVRKQELKDRTPLQKAQDTFLKWERAFKLSGITTLGKLSMAGMTRLLTSPIEEGIGGVASKLLPKIANKAEGEGGLNIKAEAKAIKAAFTKGMDDAAQTLKLGTKGGKGKSDLDLLFGKKADTPPEMLDFFGQLHSAIKAPVKRAAFERSFEKRIARNIKNGVDVSDPAVQMRIATEAYKDGQRAIFMQENFVSDSYRNWVNSLERSKKYPELGKAASTFFQWMVPFVRVPTNIVGEVGMHVGGIPYAAGKILHTAFTKGIENLTPEESEMIMRGLKKGSIGVGALLLGYFNPQNFGGYYQEGDKRKSDDVGATKARLFGVDIPTWLLHSPIFETMQLGATIRRAKDKMVKGEPQGIGEGIWAGALGLAEHEPLIDQPMRLAKIFKSSNERQYYLGELAKSTVDPVLLQNIAQWTDPKEKRKPETLTEHIEMGIPRLRENVGDGSNQGGGGAGASGKYKPERQHKLSKTHK